MDSIDWKNVSLGKQAAVLDRWVKKLNETPSILDADFHAVGVGYRQRNKCVEPVLCLRFAVTGKRKRLPKRVKTIPSNISVTIKLNEKFLRTNIPTDVTDISAGQEQARICVEGKTTKPFSLLGTSAAIVRDYQKNYYLLSCHHVLAASSKTYNLRGVSTVKISGYGFEPPNVIAKRARNARFPNTQTQKAIDASLALIKPSYLNEIKNYYRHIHGNYHIEKVSLKRKLPNKLPVKILSPMGLVKGEIVTSWPKGRPFTYRRLGGDNVSVDIKAAYEVKTENKATQLGDSGSPVVYENTLIGMHFWGNPAERLSYFIPSYLLFSSDTFRKRIKFLA